MSVKYIDPVSVYALFLNMPPEAVEIYLRDYFDGDDSLLPQAQHVYNLCHAVYLNHSEDIKTGTPFLSLYIRYQQAYSKAVKEGKPQDINLPSMKKKAQELITSSSAIAQSGFKKVPTDVYKHRIKTCEGCPLLWKQDREKMRCTKCGCFMRTKARYAAMKCPVGKW